MVVLHAELQVSPNANNNEAAYLVDEQFLILRPKLPDILSCQAETRDLAFTRFEVRFHRLHGAGAQIFIYKSLLFSSSRKYFDGATAHQQNV